MRFEDLGLDARIMSGIQSVGFITPTPIQSQTIPFAMQDKDVMGLAQTGTGKTAAFVLPMLQRLIGVKKRGIRALVITPTRELAEQTDSMIKAMSGKTGLKSMTVYGGASMNVQIDRIRKGVDIVVACPGRLLDHIRQNTIKLNFVEALVLDEADRMLDMGFLPDVRKILEHIPARRQTMMFSATMPDDIRRLTRDIMKNPETIQINHSRPADTVTHELYPVESHLKSKMLISLLRATKTDSVLVFTRTRARTKQIADKLKRVGFSAACLQGDMPQGKRQAALNGFRDGKYQILVATDIAARGVDVLNISHVINYDIPDNADSYTHRVGRTGRALRTGKAFTIVTKEDAATVRSFESEMDVELICRELEGFDYSAPKMDRNISRNGRNGGSYRTNRPKTTNGGNGRPQRKTHSLHRARNERTA